MTQIKARIARAWWAYEPGWGREGERRFRRAVLAFGLFLVVLQLL